MYPKSFSNVTSKFEKEVNSYSEWLLVSKLGVRKLRVGLRVIVYFFV